MNTSEQESESQFLNVKEVDITINGNKNYPLSGKLTFGKIKKDIPVVVLVHGSGEMDMDESIGGNKIFKDIAYELAKNNIASVRYDKVTFSYPQLLHDKNFSIEVETINDAIAAKEVVEELKDFKFSKYYICGHSLGGIVAPQIAKAAKYDGMIILAGSMRSFIDIAYDIANNFLLKDNLTQKKELDSMYEKAKNIMNLPAKELSNHTVFKMNASYVYSIDKYKKAFLIKELDIPMLVLQGSDDKQTSVYKDFLPYEMLKKDLTDLTLKEYTGLNHLFIKSNIGGPSQERYLEKKHVDKIVIEDIVNWIYSHRYIEHKRRCEKMDEIKNSCSLKNYELSSIYLEELMQIILEIWVEALEVKRISYDENFFLLGGNSLKAIKIISSLNRKFNIVPELTLQTLFSAPTIRMLAKKINELDVITTRDDREVIGGII